MLCVVTVLAINFYLKIKIKISNSLLRSHIIHICKEMDLHELSYI